MIVDIPCFILTIIKMVGKERNFWLRLVQLVSLIPKMNKMTTAFTKHTAKIFSPKAERKPIPICSSKKLPKKKSRF